MSDMMGKILLIVLVAILVYILVMVIIAVSTSPICEYAGYDHAVVHFNMERECVKEIIVPIEEIISR